MRMQLAQHRAAMCHHTAHTFPPTKNRNPRSRVFFCCWGWGVMLLDQLSINYLIQGTFTSELDYSGLRKVIVKLFDWTAASQPGGTL